MSRFEVHSHTEYSNLRLVDCINKLPTLIKYAQEIGLAGIAITDHECLSGHVEANIIGQKIAEDSDFKVALGNEIYLTDNRDKGQKYYHFILISKDAEGHRQLRELSSSAWLNSYYDRGMERVPTLKGDLKKIVGKNPGHIIATTACIGGELSSNVLLMENARKVGDFKTAEVHKQKIINFVLEMKEIFGDDFYFEIAPGASLEQIIVNRKILELANVFSVKVVIGSDAHYLTKKDRWVHKAYLNSNNGEREVDDFYEYSYLQEEDDLLKNLSASNINEDIYKTLCKNSMEIFDKIQPYSLLHSQQIPKVEVKDYPRTTWESEQAEDCPILNSMFNSDNKIERYWINECFNALDEKGLKKKEYIERLEEEADIKRTIGKKLNTNMFAYPVTLQHYVDLFWECGSTVGAGRGSSCSGLNHYLLGITQIDPLEWDLPFWRYLNKERIELGSL